MSRRANQHSMEPDASPGGGGRRLNNIPMYIFGGVVLMFIIVMGMVASDRATRSRAARDKTAGTTLSQQGVNTSLLARAIVGDHISGIIRPVTSSHMFTLRPPGQKPAKKTISLPGQVSQKHFITPEKSLQVPIHTHPLATPRRAEDTTVLRRIRMMRLNMLEQAIRGRTGVQVGRSHTRSIPVQREMHGEKPHTEKEVMEHVHQLLAATQGSDTSSAHEEGYAQFDSKDAAGRWQLHAAVDPPLTKYELRAGFVIPATLIAGVNSDLPGQIMAQVAQNVYDTAIGKYLLIPQGSRLVGTCSIRVAYGQARILVAWQRIVFPDGKALDIGSMPGADAAGYAGFHDQVNNHYLRIFGSALLMSGITAGISWSQGGNIIDPLAPQTFNSEMSQSLGQNLGRTATKLIEKNLNIAPTLEIRPGYRFNVMVTKDITFLHPYHEFDY